MKFTRIHLALVAATSMTQGMVMAETSDVGTISSKATPGAVTWCRRKASRAAPR